MNRKSVGVAGLVSAMAAAPAMGAQAAPHPAPAVPVAYSYADLLEPIPNAMERLQASEAADAAEPHSSLMVETQYIYHHHHHHHHWRRRWYHRRWFRHHHHHHHY